MPKMPNNSLGLDWIGEWYMIGKWFLGGDLGVQVQKNKSCNK